MKGGDTGLNLELTCPSSTRVHARRHLISKESSAHEETGIELGPTVQGQRLHVNPSCLLPTCCAPRGKQAALGRAHPSPGGAEAEWAGGGGSTRERSWHCQAALPNHASHRRVSDSKRARWAAPGERHRRGCEAGKENSEGSAIEKAGCSASRHSPSVRQIESPRLDGAVTEFTQQFHSCWLFLESLPTKGDPVLERSIAKPVHSHSLSSQVKAETPGVSNQRQKP